MQRILVIGSGGAGKSTFAARLADISGLPLIHLDREYWRPGWVETPEDEWATKVDRLVGKDAWIIDGNYGGTMHHRLKACDTVIFLDIPRPICLQRVVRRRIRFQGRSRADMTNGCPERLTWAFVRWIWRYPQNRRPTILQRLSQLRPDQRSVVLRSGRDIEHFLKTVSIIDV